MVDIFAYTALLQAFVCGMAASGLSCILVRVITKATTWHLHSHVLLCAHCSVAGDCVWQGGQQPEGQAFCCHCVNTTLFSLPAVAAAGVCVWQGGQWPELHPGARHHQGHAA
jgi:hypothetical protein